MSAPLPSPSPLPPWLERRPTKRAECPPPDQQCPWVSCRHHLAFDLKKRRTHTTGHNPPAPDRLILSLPEDPANWPDDAQTCSLHVADGGAHTLEEVGTLMGDISRERVRQLEQSALAKLARLGIILDLGEDFGLDTTTRAPRNQRPSAEAKGHHTNEWRPRSTDPELDGTYIGGFRSQDMTAKMRRIQAESAPPVRTLSPDAVDLSGLLEDVARKRNPNYKPRPLVTLDTFSQRAESSRMRGGAATASTARIISPAKALPTTTPRQPSPPSTSSFESPPAVLPATIQSDDQPEVAVAAALPDPSPETPPMPYPPSRKANAPYAQAAALAIEELMHQRRMKQSALVDACAAAYPHIKPTSIGTSILSALSATGSPVSVWYRRIANVLGVELSALCADPAWLEQVQQEGSPRVTCHTPPPPQVSPSATPPAPVKAAKGAEPEAAATNALAPLLIEAIKQAQAIYKRVAEQATVIDLLRRECDDLRQQLAATVKERDAATSTLADIRRLTHQGKP